MSSRLDEKMCDQSVLKKTMTNFTRNQRLRTFLSKIFYENPKIVFNILPIESKIKVTEFGKCFVTPNEMNNF